MAIGIIGVGRLGGALAKGLSRAEFGEVYVFGRTPERVRAVLAEAPGVTALASSAEVFERCEVVFVWMDPAAAGGVLSANAEILQRRRPLIVTCAPGLAPGDYSPKWADTLPNVNLSTGLGATLLAWGPGLSDAERASALAPLRACGAVYEMAAEELTHYSALASNGPAFYAQLMELWADALAERHGYDKELCRAMVRQTVAGTIALQDQDGIDAAEVIHRVAHPGGSTLKGLAVIDTDFPSTAQNMLRAMDKW
jgi:pyrroline-5-carboxylate reductase